MMEKSPSSWLRTRNLSGPNFFIIEARQCAIKCDSKAGKFHRYITLIEKITCKR